jgi:hypothetical protein
MERNSSQHFRAFLEIYFCAVFLVYSTSLLTFFWELRSLLLRFPLGDIVGFLAYQLAFALAESLILAIVVTILVLLMPIRQVREHPAVVGGLFVFSFAVSSLIFKAGPQLVRWMSTALPVTESAAAQTALFLCVFAAIGLPAIAILMTRSQKITALLKTRIEDLSVLAGLYTVLGILGVLIVMYRNLA